MVLFIKLYVLTGLDFRLWTSKGCNFFKSYWWSMIIKLSFSIDFSIAVYSSYFLSLSFLGSSLDPLLLL